MVTSPVFTQYVLRNVSKHVLNTKCKHIKFSLMGGEQGSKKKSP